MCSLLPTAQPNTHSFFNDETLPYHVLTPFPNRRSLAIMPFSKRSCDSLSECSQFPLIILSPRVPCSLSYAASTQCIHSFTAQCLSHPLQEGSGYLSVIALVIRRRFSNHQLTLQYQNNQQLLNKSHYFPFNNSRP